MRKIRVLNFISLAAITVAGLAASGSAQASPVAGRFGLGVIDTLGQGAGINGVYDGGPWHADATIALAKIDDAPIGDNDSRLSLGVHGWYHLNNGASSDFSVGGGLSFFRVDPPGDNNTRSAVSIDAGFQIRAFVTSNVAVSGFGGLQIVTGDSDGYALGGQPLGAFALTYFF